MLRRVERPRKEDFEDPDAYLNLIEEPSYIFIKDGLRIGRLNLVFKPEQSLVEVWSVWIEPQFRGVGFGKAMMRDAIKLARRLGYKHMWLSVFKDNLAAQNCYKAVGFKLTQSGFSLKEGRLDLEKTKVQRVLH